MFSRVSDAAGTAFTLTLPTAEGYEVVFDYRWTPAETRGAALSASLSLTSDGTQALLVTAEGEGLPREGDLSGEGRLTLAASGSLLSEPPAAQTFAFNWSRTAAEKPYTLI